LLSSSICYNLNAKLELEARSASTSTNLGGVFINVIYHKN
jgi:hypothetical protein